MTFLITGATGTVGSRVAELLIGRGERPRLFVRDRDKAQARFGGRAELVVGDLADYASLEQALRGLDRLFLVNSGPQIPVLDELAARAAGKARVKHLVKLSSMDVEHGLAIGAWHERGEAAIRASGVPYTFVRPTGFMTNLLAWATSIKAKGVICTSTGNGRRAFIHPDDIAAVAARILTSSDYEGEALPITGPEALTFADVAARIGAAIGKPVVFQPLSDEEARQSYSQVSGSGEETEAHVALWRAIREGRLGAVTNHVERLLGRQPIALDQWVMENVQSFR